MNIRYIFLLLIIFGFTACEDDEGMVVIPPVELDPGSADFSNYVSLGSSLMSGFTDFALFKTAQSNSLPNILSQNFAQAGGGGFSQPLTNDDIGGLLLGGNVIQPPRLYFDGSGPALLDATPTTEVSSIQPGPYNNMGVPGAKIFHLPAQGYGNIAGLAIGAANPYYVRMASSSNASMMEDALMQNPSFFTLWIGNNDVLSYAISGGTGVDQTGNYNPLTYGQNDITDPTVFAQVYSGLIQGLTAGGAQGVVANIPDVTKTAYFTTVPYNPLDPSNPDFAPLIPALNETFAQLNQAYAYLGVPERSIVFSETIASPVVIQDESIANIAGSLYQVLVGGGLDPLQAGLLANQYGQTRQAKESDLLVLPTLVQIAEVNVAYYTQLVTAGVPAEIAGQLSVNGITYPLQDESVLLPTEQLEIKDATDAYNVTIGNLVSQSGLAFFDAHAYMDQLATMGAPSGDFILTSAFVQGGAFGLDGVHPTSRGYAAIANEFLKAIDLTYGSNFEEAGALNDIGEYPTNYNPALR